MEATKFVHTYVDRRERVVTRLRVKKISAPNADLLNVFLSEGEAYTRTLVEVVHNQRDNVMFLFYTEQSVCPAG